MMNMGREYVEQTHWQVNTCVHTRLTTRRTCNG